MKGNIMKTPDEEMRPEYDFSGGVRGKYVTRLAQGTNVVVLDKDVAKEFENSAAVNDALRALIGVIQKHRGKKPAKRPKQPA
ncbi:MAG: hypothetical protein KGJ19_05260 [Betaproteobacteria bacterium]|nr:hypothetical protein [Betaproteobacteria bacterium]